MNFEELVTRKIEERRAGFMADVCAAAEADERLHRRLEPLRKAVLAMIDELSLNPMFAVAMGKPQIVITRNDEDDRSGDLQLKGLAGTLSFNIYGHTAYGNCMVGTRLDPSPVVSAAFRCSRSYGDGADTCDLIRVSELIDRARNHFGDFLADMYLSSSYSGEAPSASSAT